MRNFSRDGCIFSEKQQKLSLPLEADYQSERTAFSIMDRFALSLAILGALNWGSVGIFNFDAIAWIFGGSTAAVSRIIYAVIALAGIWCISLLFRDRERSRIEEL